MSRQRKVSGMATQKSAGHGGWRLQSPAPLLMAGVVWARVASVRHREKEVEGVSASPVESQPERPRMIYQQSHQGHPHQPRKESPECRLAAQRTSSQKQER